MAGVFGFQSSFVPKGQADPFPPASQNQLFSGSAFGLGGAKPLGSMGSGPGPFAQQASAPAPQAAKTVSGQPATPSPNQGVDFDSVSRAIGGPSFDVSPQGAQRVTTQNRGEIARQIFNPLREVAGGVLPGSNRDLDEAALFDLRFGSNLDRALGSSDFSQQQLAQISGSVPELIDAFQQARGLASSLSFDPGITTSRIIDRQASFGSDFGQHLSNVLLNRQRDLLGQLFEGGFL